MGVSAQIENNAQWRRGKGVRHGRGRCDRPWWRRDGWRLKDVLTCGPHLSATGREGRRRGWLAGVKQAGSESGPQEIGLREKKKKSRYGLKESEPTDWAKRRRGKRD
jgi:hypothetical protein